MDDALLILEDTNGDGKADKRTVFAGDLNNPTGFEFWNGGVLLAQAPNLVFLKDTNGDDKYDTKEIVLGGMDSTDTHHTMNSFTFDPGGALYIREGIFHRSQVETPWGPTRAPGRRRRLPLRAADVQVRDLHPDELPQPARPHLRPVGPRHHLRRDRRAAVLRALDVDEEVLPGDGIDQGAAPRAGPHAAGRRRRDHLQPPLPRRDAGQPRRPEHDRLQGPAELQDHRGRRRAEDDRGRADPRVVRRELPAGRRRDRRRRRALRRRLAEPDHRPHAAQPARHLARSRPRPHLSRDLPGPSAAQAGGDRRRADSGRCSICSRSRRIASAIAPRSS